MHCSPNVWMLDTCVSIRNVHNERDANSETKWKLWCASSPSSSLLLIVALSPCRMSLREFTFLFCWYRIAPIAEFPKLTHHHHDVAWKTQIKMQVYANTLIPNWNGTKQKNAERKKQLMSRTESSRVEARQGKSARTRSQWAVEYKSQNDRENCINT